MQVKEIMTKEVIRVKRSTTLTELIEYFKEFHTFPLVPVVDENGRLIGIVSFRNLMDIFRPRQPQILKSAPFVDEVAEDIFKAELTSEMGDLIIVDDIMEKNFFSIDEEASLEDAYNLMRLHSIEKLHVVDREGKLVGFVGIFDIIMSIFREKGIVR